MVGYVYVCGSLLLLLACSSTIQQQPNQECIKPGPWFEDVPYPYLYRKFETALIKNRTVLDNIRTLFITEEGMDYTTFAIKFEVDHGENVSCAADISPNKAFCKSDLAENNWKLCPAVVNSDDDSTQFVFLKALSNSKLAFLLLWLSALHGNVLQFVIQELQDIIVNHDLMFLKSYYFESASPISITLKIEELNCNPSYPFVKCVLSELLSWINVYSYSESKPQNWDKKKKGVAVYGISNIFFGNNNELQLLQWPVSLQAFTILGLTEYMFVSLSLALVIAKLFPVVHNQIVSRATSLGHQSLYWGTVVISNVFTYGLLFAASRGWSIFEQNGLLLSEKLTNVSLIAICIQELIIYVILFMAAIMTLQNSSFTSIPKGMAKVIITISLCWTCVFLCICRSGHKRTKTIRVLIAFSLMSFIYHNIMNFISFLFLLFIDWDRSIAKILTLLYISLLVFLIFFLSLSLFSLLHDDNVQLYKQVSKFVGSVCSFVAIFIAAILLVVMYMIAFFSLKLEGFTGIVAGLLPSIALSATSWFIKNRLVRERNYSNTTTDQTEYGITGMSINNDEEVIQTEDNTDDQNLIPH